jgi:hypothetical protein
MHALTTKNQGGHAPSKLTARWHEQLLKGPHLLEDVAAVA